ncbi:hypothetical protein HKD37_05G012891 [Glycine soja]
MRVGNSDIYGFLEPQSIQRSGQSQFESESYIKSWMQSSQCDVYLGAYQNGGHWQMVVILPKEHLVVWFCSLHNRPDNYLKGIINRKGPITRTMSKRLQEDWARAAEEGPRVLMNLRTHLLLEVASPLSLPSPFRCHLSSKKQRNPLMKKILGLQTPMELASCGIKSIFI